MDMAAESEDQIRAFVDQRLKELGLKMAPVSEDLLHLNHAYLQQYIKRGVPGRLPEDVRGRLAAILKVPEDRLKPASSEPSTLRPAPAAPKMPTYSSERRDVPVWGTTQGGPNGSFEVYYDNEPVDYVMRLPGIETARTVYALWVVGDSMYPKFEGGELIYINPSKPPSVGGYVVIKLKPNHDGDQPRCYLKRLVRRTAEKVICEQFNPAKEVSFPQAEIVSIHRVLTTAELAGAFG